MIDVPTSTLPVASRQLKRLCDLLTAGLLIVLASPLFFLIYLLLKLSSRHPVLFRQSRVGEGGRTFTMYKFRSMLPVDTSFDAELYDEREHKSPDNPRITRIGRILRKTSLDELPQLFNILKGDMSLVGPRPELPWIVEGYQPWQYERLTVPQGLTGWWQINGRSDKPLHENVEYDIYYVRHYSLLLDLQIVLRTPWAIFKGVGAF